MNAAQTMRNLPEVIHDVGELEELLSRPTDAVVRTLGQVEGDILILGAAGKMGPTLARMACRATAAAGVPRKIIGVSRFSGPGPPPSWNRSASPPFRASCWIRPSSIHCPTRPT